MNKPLVAIYGTVALDAAGIGLIFPILPRLLQEVAHTPNVAAYVGIMTALYAFMQFVFSPLLGRMSDTLGRRPVLLISLVGSTVNYAVMAFAPQLWMLFVGRAIAGLTSANVAVASAYVTDISPEDQLARRFGLFNAMFGVGFIVGPVLGGLLGDAWLRLPFLVAAILTGLNLLLAIFLLPESRVPSRERIDLAALNPVRPLRWVFEIKGLLPIVLVFFLLSGSGEAYGTCWALWGFDAFRWNGFWIGLSLGTFGVCQTLAQAFLPGPATKLLGERAAVLAGIGCACVALVLLAFATHPWIVFSLMPLFALTGIGTPGFQALATRQVDPSRQGQLQGVLASAVSLASILAPLAFSTFYFAVQKHWPGAIWLSVLVPYVAAIPLVVVGTRPGRQLTAKATA